ncbi:MAG: LacI family DNA-binding transcriptional regulator [Sphaerochaetaceae bacterium]|nr:LacI family DNA-binding transcriptional regulator [Sphaerochaetaceae bacterium]
MEKNVTMKDIAEELDISTVSVSKALNGKEGIGDEVREKILVKASEMGYTKQNKKRTSLAQPHYIGIAVADRFCSDNAFYSEMWRALLIQCSQKNYTGLIEIITSEDEYAPKLPKFVSNQKVEGIIILGEVSRPYIDLIASQKIPYVLLDFHQDLFDDDSVTSDGCGGSYAITNYLLKKGYREIGYLGTLSATSSIMDRYLGYVKALLMKGISIDNNLTIPDRDEEGTIALSFDLPKKLPEAFVCNCDETAYKLINQLRNMGIKVPQDIAIVGFDDSHWATNCIPQLTTVRVDMERMAKLSLTHLLKQIEDPNVASERVVVATELIVRDSVK